MTLTESLKAQGYWNDEFNLPVYGGDSHVLLATYWKLSSPLEKTVMYPLPYAHLFKCEGPVKDGMMYRWPGNPEPRTSHDELIGIASMDSSWAYHVLQFLQHHDWIYDSVNPESGDNRWLLSRFIFFPPYMRAASRSSVNYIHQLAWALYAIWVALNPNAGDTSTRILFYLMLPAAEHYPIMDMGAWAFKKIMQRKYPRGPKELLGRYHGKDHPFSQYAPELF